MKKLIVVLVIATFALTTSYSQDESGGIDPTAQDSWVIEINTGFGESSTSNTGFSLMSRDYGDENVTAWGAGAEVGYFLIEDLALKLGLGYFDSGFEGMDGMFNWKFGGKYYIAGQFPVGIDVNGSTGNDVSPLWLGFQAAYAWFVADNVSIEPGLRYGLGMNEDAGDGDFNIFGINIGFNLYLN